MTPGSLAGRLYRFALRVPRLVDAMPRDRVGARTLGEQLVDAATSSAANYEEVRGAVSHVDFTAKLAISYKEIRESVFWLRMIRDAELHRNDKMTDIIREGKELRAILGSSLKTARQHKERS